MTTSYEVEIKATGRDLETIFAAIQFALKSPEAASMGEAGGSIVGGTSPDEHPTRRANFVISVTRINVHYKADVDPSDVVLS